KDMADVVGNAYRENGSWDFLRENETLWRQLNAPHFPGSPTRDRGRPPNDIDHGRGPRAFDPGSPQRDVPPGHPAPRDAGGPRPPRGFGPDGGPEPRRRDFGPGGGSMSGLLDETKHAVVGNTALTSDSVLQPVVVDGRTVGWLTGNFVYGPMRDLDRRFQDKQRSTLWMIGAIALLLSAMVALLLARGLLAPVKRLATAT